MPKRREQVSVPLDEDLRVFVEQTAAREHGSIAGVIRRFVAEAGPEISDAGARGMTSIPQTRSPRLHRPNPRAASRVAWQDHLELIQTVLRNQISEWRERFPTVAEMSNDKASSQRKKALEEGPRTHDWKWTRVRKSFMRAVGREKLK